MFKPPSFQLPSFELSSGDPAVHLKLYRYVPEHIDNSSEPRKAVLLLHGASASHRTFITPREDGGLAAWLTEQHFDPWLLDWRGSGCVVDDEKNESSLLGAKTALAYNFNTAAKHDIRAAITVMQEHVEGKIAAVGFCMGAAILAESVALGYITADDVDCIVLMTLGLFYEATIDGRVKCEDRVLEHLAQTIRDSGLKPWIDPRMDNTTPPALKARWHDDLENLYTEWPGALKSHAEEANRTPQPSDEALNRMCNRLSFMYGMPYHHQNLVPSIHGSGGDGLLPTLFGPIPLHMFIHGARNIRKGHATFYDLGGDDERFLSAAAHDNFKNLSTVTLITGALNRLWHRNSIDLMYEWLCRGTAEHRRKFRKHVFPNYAHQDLLWGAESRQRIFPAIKAGLEANFYADSVSRAS